MMFNITLIEDTKSRPLTKIYKLTDDGLKSDKIPSSSIYHWQEQTISQLQDLAHGLKFALKPSQAILQGRVKDNARKQKRINRRHKEHADRHKPDLEHKETALLCLDVDKFTGYDRSLSDQEIVDQFILNHLPQEFHNASYVYQLSSSYKAIDEKGLCVHIFFHLNKAMALTSQKAYVKSIECEYLDLSIYNPSSIIYVAPPVFSKDGAFLYDPKVNDHKFERINYIEKQNEHVSPPSIAFQEIKTPVIQHRSKILDYHGTDKGAESLCQDAMRELSTTVDNRNRASYRKAVTLGRLIAAGRLDQSYAYAEFIDACIANGMYQKRGESYCKQQFNKGLTDGSKNPYYKRELPSPKVTYKKPLANDYKPHTNDEINSITDMLMNRAIENAQVNHPYIVQIATGAGKTYKAIMTATQLIKENQTVIIALPNYQIMGEVQELLNKFSPEVEPVLIVGRTKNCELYQTANEVNQRNYDEILEERSIPSFCKIADQGKECPFIATCTNKDDPIYHLEGRLALTTHAKLSSLPELPENTLIMIDESPKLTYTDKINIDLIKPLISIPSDKENKTSEQKFRNEYSCLSDLAEYVLGIATKLMQGHKGKRTSDRLLYDALTQSNQGYAIQLAKAVLKANEDGIKVPNVNVKQLFITNGKVENKLRRKSVNLIVNVAKIILNDYEHNVRIAYQENLSNIEIRYKLKLPECKTIILDATPQSKLWKAYCESLGIELTIDRATEIKAPISTGYFIKTGVFQSSQLFDQDGQLTQRAINSLNAVNMDSPTIKALEKLSSDSLAIGTHKKLVSALESAESDDRLKDSQFIKSLSKFNKIFGYTGKHDKGVNMFNECDSILILGTPKPNLRELRADFKAINPELDNKLQDELYYEASQAILTQWIGRLRGVRRGGLNYIYVGQDAPPNVLGIQWNNFEINRGRKTKSLNGIIDKVKAELEGGRALSINQIVSTFKGCTRYLAKKVIDIISRQIQLSCETIRNGIKLYTASCENKCTNHNKQELTGSLSSSENNCTKVNKAIEGGEIYGDEPYNIYINSIYFHSWQNLNPPLTNAGSQNDKPPQLSPHSEGHNRTNLTHTHVDLSHEGSSEMGYDKLYPPLQDRFLDRMKSKWLDRENSTNYTHNASAHVGLSHGFPEVTHAR